MPCTERALWDKECASQSAQLTMQLKSANSKLRQALEDKIVQLRRPERVQNSTANAGWASVQVLERRSSSQLQMPPRQAARSPATPISLPVADKMHDRTSLGSKSPPGPNLLPCNDDEGGRLCDATLLPPLGDCKSLTKPVAFGLGDRSELRKRMCTSGLKVEVDQQIGVSSPRSKSSSSYSSPLSGTSTSTSSPPAMRSLTAEMASLYDKASPSPMPNVRCMTALERFHGGSAKDSKERRTSQGWTSQGVKVAHKERCDSKEETKRLFGRPSSLSSLKARKGLEGELHGHPNVAPCLVQLHDHLSVGCRSQMLPANLAALQRGRLAESQQPRDKSSSPQPHGAKLSATGSLPLGCMRMLSQESAEESEEDSLGATWSRRLLSRRRFGGLDAGTKGDEPFTSQQSSGSKGQDNDEAPITMSSWNMGPLPQPEEQEALKEIRVLKDETIYDLYCWDEVLQEMGDGGKVVVCRPKNSLEEAFGYVMKIRSKESLRKQNHEEQFRKSQIRMLNFPQDACIITTREVLEDDRFYYIVMDRAMGGSFFTSLVEEFQDGSMPQHAVKRVIREILEAVHHLHRNGLLHRDIKPDNLVMRLLDDSANPGAKLRRVVLIDFDHADPDWSPGKQSTDYTCYGTLRFNAPEALCGDYSAASDLYSVGVILYLLMTGKMPHSDSLFEDGRDCEDEAEGWLSESHQRWMDQVYALMQEQPVDWDCDPWPELPDCRRFCASLLAFSARERPRSAGEALRDGWLAA